jgi:hypothetical protein
MLGQGRRRCTQNPPNLLPRQCGIKLWTREGLCNRLARLSPPQATRSMTWMTAFRVVRE